MEAALVSSGRGRHGSAVFVRAVKLAMKFGSYFDVEIGVLAGASVGQQCW